MADKPHLETALRAVVVDETGKGDFQQLVTIGHHRLLADEPASMGGGGTGPTPYDLLLASLGTCTAMTIRMYARLKEIPLEGVRVTLRHDRVHAEDCADCETREGRVDRLTRRITLTGPELTGEQRKRMLEIADKCPVHRTLTSDIIIVTEEDVP
ncbi:MAG: OsmC family protein [Acetobacterales bacterium]